MGKKPYKVLDISETHDIMKTIYSIYLFFYFYHVTVASIRENFIYEF